MVEDTVWILVLSPPDPDAGLWSGTIGPGGTINWPSQIDPNPVGGEILDDPAPAPLTASAVVVNQASDLGALPAGDAAPIT
jgi:hypothetical protein